jgi:hypothetical protein
VLLTIYGPLKEPNWIGRALTEEDNLRLLKTGVMRPEWETAYLAAIRSLPRHIKLADQL